MHQYPAAKNYSLSRGQLTRLRNDIHLQRIDRSEIKRYLNKFKKKAPGASKRNKQIFEKGTDKALDQLTNIYNACLTTGYFPQAFLKAIIKFILKENKSPTNPLNYRPISLLEGPGIVFEKMIQGRINHFLAEKG